MSFAEFGEIFHRLLEEIKHTLETEHQDIAAVAPILRSGGITGLMLAVHFGIKTVLPIQYKYHSPNEKPSLIFSAFDHMPVSSLHKNSVILICETNTVTGNTLKEVLPMLRQHFPKQNFWYATLAKSISLPAKHAGIEHYFFGIETEEGISEKLPMHHKNVWKGVALFPWENKQEEIKEIVEKEE